MRRENRACRRGVMLIALYFGAGLLLSARALETRALWLATALADG